jgi:hypothetical protein
MDKENLWEVCEHIFFKGANEVWLRGDKIALCKRCTVGLSPERVQTVNESQLRDLIEDMAMVIGLEHLDKKE